MSDQTHTDVSPGGFDTQGELQLTKQIGKEETIPKTLAVEEIEQKSDESRSVNEKGNDESIRAIIEEQTDISNSKEASVERAKQDTKMVTEITYVAPVEDPYDKAMAYYSKHNIIELFQGLTAGLVFHRPEDPLQYMIEEVERIQEKEKYKKHEIRKEDAEPEKTEHTDSTQK